MKKGHSKDFLSKFSHDTRTPLTVIGNFLSYISVDIRDEEARAFCEAASTSLDKVTRLVDLLEAHGKKETCLGDGTITISRGPFDVSGLISRVFTEVRPLAKDAGVRLSFIGPDHLLCMIDGLALERVMANLVRNAIEAADKTGAYVEVCLFQHSDSISIEVRDNGNGIPSENIGKIFSNGFTHGKSMGTGIGLSYCKEVIEAHGGCIAVYSRPDEGSLFSILIPSVVIAACNRAQALLQVCVIGEGRPDLNMWVSRWQGDHGIEKTAQVASHRFMLDSQEDSLGIV